MLSTRTLLALSLGAAALTAGCSRQEARPERPRVDQPAPESRVTLSAEVIKGMSLRQKVGQLFIPAVGGEAHGLRLIEKYGVGGFLYLPENVRDPEGTAKLSSTLQGATRLPLLIGIEQGERVSGMTSFPGPMALAATRDPALVRAAAAVTGSELRTVGINQEYTPVADFNVNPHGPMLGLRSFGSDAALVGQLIGASIDGYRAAGIASTVKHLPESTSLPVVTHTRAQWETLDAPSFRAAVEHGADSIMPAHLRMSGLATRSRRVTTRLLRGDLGFRGVIVTDSLGRATGGVSEAAVRAVLAGADQLLMPPNLPRAYAGVLQAVRTGRIPLTRLNDAVLRILRLKEKRGLFGGITTRPVDTAEHRRTALDVATRAVTVIKNRRALPLKGTVSVTGPARFSLAAALKKEGVRVVSAAGHTVIVTTSDARPVTGRYLAGLARRRTVIMISTGRPYDLRHADSAHAAVATYSSSRVSMRGLAKVLSGRALATGRLPVTIPGGPDFGAGLTY